MADSLEKFIQDGKRIALNPEEKSAGREAFLVFIRKHPVSAPTKERHPFWSSWLSLTLKPMPLILILALLVGGGTSFAAEQALPGNPLYPIKIAVNEEVRGWISFSPEAKAGWENRRAERRLEEAETLAAEGRLNAKTQATVEENFGEHAERIADYIKKFEDKEDFQAVAELSSHFETSLKAHEQILAKLAEHTRKEKNDNDLDVLREDVAWEASVAQNRREDAEARISDGSDVEAKAAAEAKLRVAERKIAEVRALIARVQTSLGAQATVKAEARLAVAQEFFVRGKAKFDVKAYGEAFALFQKAHKIAQEGKVLIRARNNLRIDVSLNGVASEESEHGSEPQETESKKVEWEGHTEKDETAEHTTTTSLDVESRGSVEQETEQTKIESEGRLKLKLGL